MPLFNLMPNTCQWYYNVLFPVLFDFLFNLIFFISRPLGVPW